ncbi:malate/lactate/ureidoglycolate dehydrogenase [Rhodovarius lipocyclicus]|uniref:malate/lactate/ureidoglycolate dehydrogenase n=1 Tax=Rhodovarius lipocyclicus TaxID=268410 RepID=UPI001359F7CC|nr:malate/lactate/ureidoglycolate dehydrogenase [Rhodovarius lipocyclicus]
MAATDIHIPAPVLEGVIDHIFRAAGCSEKESARIASHLLGANLAGHDSHGVVRVPRYVEWLEAGFVLKGQQASIISDGGAFVLFDGHFGFGQTVAEQATQFAIARALETGSCIMGLRNAGHIGRVGDYSEMALRAGLIAINFVNVGGSVLVAPFGGTERRFSTAPISVGVPLPDGPVLLDFATSFVAEGKVLVASNGGKALPEGALIEPDGRLSADPHTLYGHYEAVGPRNASLGQGAIRAFGDHKGSGLALICELLAGALTGSATSGPVKERGRITNGMLSILLSPRHFGDVAAFEAAGRNYVEWVKACHPADPASPVLIPGEPEAKRRAERLAHGVPLPQEAWANIRATAVRLGVTIPEGL